MLLSILREKVAKGFPWLALESFSIATRLSVCDHEGAERVAGQIRVASKQLMLCRAIEKRKVRAIHETPHRCDRLNPLEFTDVHRVASLLAAGGIACGVISRAGRTVIPGSRRSEERRVGKECRCGGARDD